MKQNPYEELCYATNNFLSTLAASLGIPTLLDYLSITLSKPRSKQAHFWMGYFIGAYAAFLSIILVKAFQ